MEEWSPIPLKQIFSQILEKGNYIQISGGEPLLHPKVFEIVYFVKTRKPWAFLEFQSNGTLLLKNDNLGKLIKLGVNLFNINYPCHIESVNDEIVWMKWTLKTREDGMHAIIERWANLRVNIIVNKLNYIYISDMVDHIYKNFSWLERIQLSFTKAMWAADKNDDVVPRYEDASPYFIEGLKKAKEYNIVVDVDHIPMCFLGEFFEQHVDYHKKKIGEEWVFLKEKHFVEKCTSCDKRNFCSGYRDDYLDVYSL
jgi:MoaA/NifB/PqqE/SkfB family radical SAM enzyme